MFDLKQLEIEQAESEFGIFGFRYKEFLRLEKYYEKHPVVAKSGKIVEAHEIASRLSYLAWQHRKEQKEKLALAKS